MTEIYKFAYIDFKRGQYFFNLRVIFGRNLLLWRRAYINSQQFLLEKDDDICRSLCSAGLLTRARIFKRLWSPGFDSKA
jgi:hypothetical protein